METVAVILSVKPDQVEAFEAGFREHELPIWHDYEAEGVMTRASLTRLDISSARRGGHSSRRGARAPVRAARGRTHEPAAANDHEHDRRDACDRTAGHGAVHQARNRTIRSGGDRWRRSRSS